MSSDLEHMSIPPSFKDAKNKQDYVNKMNRAAAALEIKRENLLFLQDWTPPGGTESTIRDLRGRIMVKHPTVRFVAKHLNAGDLQPIYYIMKHCKVKIDWMFHCGSNVGPLITEAIHNYDSMVFVLNQPNTKVTVDLYLHAISYADLPTMAYITEQMDAQTHQKLLRENRDKMGLVVQAMMNCHHGQTMDYLFFNIFHYQWQPAVYRNPEIVEQAKRVDASHINHFMEQTSLEWQERGDLL